LPNARLKTPPPTFQGWLEQLRSDKKLLIVQAAAQAQKAADFILGTEHEEGDSHE
jgi:antirestriction protein ArdC